MRVLRSGQTGDDVLAWQLFLAESGYDVGRADGDFGPKTFAGTKLFQTHHLLVVDGIVGAQSLKKAMELGFDPLEWPTDTPANATSDPYWPSAPANLKYLSVPRAEALYGSFKWKKAPTTAEPRAIKLLDNWGSTNIIKVDIPQLARIGKPASIGRYMHRLAAPKILRLWDEWEKAKLLKLVKTFDGLYNPRVIGGTSTLSNHAFGAAFDINYSWNKLGDQPALAGKLGSVRELVPIANSLGFYWGGHFSGKKDGMHFELVDPS